MLEVKGIDVFYGDLQALWDVSLNVKEGELVSIIGPNGAGKTTLLKTIMGLLRPRKGSINFLGQEITKLKPHRIVELGIGVVPEGRRIFPYMSVYDNLVVAAYMARAREKVKDTLEWVFNLFPILKERKNQMASTLSGGEQQMLTIARALITRPKLLMFDEPSLGLAPVIVSNLINVIKKLNAEGITILLVEQNVRDALEIADRAYVLETGKIILEGTSKELLENEHVKEAFLGI